MVVQFSLHQHQQHPQQHLHHHHHHQHSHNFTHRFSVLLLVLGILLQREVQGLLLPAPGLESLQGEPLQDPMEDLLGPTDQDAFLPIQDPPQEPLQEPLQEPRCSLASFAEVMTLNDLDKVIQVVATNRGRSVKELLTKLSGRHGLYVKVQQDSLLSALRQLLPELRKVQENPETPFPKNPMRGLRPLDLQRPPPSAPEGLRPIASHAQRHDVSGPMLEEGQPWLLPKKQQSLPTGPARPPRDPQMAARVPVAWVVVEGELGGKEKVELAPRMAVLDVLREARTTFALNHGPFRHNPFSYKLGTVGLEGEGDGAPRCLDVQTMGALQPAHPGRPLHLTITRTTNQSVRSVWSSSCIPKASELVVVHGDVIAITSRAP